MAKRYLVKFTDSVNSLEDLATELSSKGAEVEKIYSRLNLIRFKGEENMLENFREIVLFVQEIKKNFRSQ